MQTTSGVVCGRWLEVDSVRVQAGPKAFFSHLHIGTRETDAREKEKGQLSSGITSKTRNLLPPGLAFSQSQNGITR